MKHMYWHISQYHPAKQIHKSVKWEQHGLKYGTHLVLRYRVPSAFAQGQSHCKI